VPLPAPAAGGTCGPGTSSESALEAFFDPVSIGAGRLPPAASGGRPQCHAFVDECQSATNTRITVAGIILVVSLVTLIGNAWIVRRVSAGASEEARHTPAAWYPDPDGAGALRWWDGRRWGPSASRPGDTGPPWTGPPGPGPSTPDPAVARQGDPWAPS